MITLRYTDHDGLDSIRTDVIGMTPLDSEDAIWLDFAYGKSEKIYFKSNTLAWDFYNSVWSCISGQNGFDARRMQKGE